MGSLNCLSYKRLVILHKLRCANCVTKILYFFHTTKLSVPVFSNFCLHTDFLFVPNYRIIEFCLHTEYRRQSRIFLFFFSCPELSNFNHTEYRGRSRIFFFSSCHEFSNFIFLVPRLVLGPTDQREVIIEFSNFCLP